MIGSVDDLARRCFELEAKETPTVTGTGTVGFFLILAVAMLLAPLVAPDHIGLVVGGLGLLAVGELAASRMLLVRRYASRRLKAYRAGDPGTVQVVYRFAVTGFRQQIEAHRARTLGNDSEWAIARGSLTEAADEAQRSVAYWRARVEQEPDNQLVAGQLGAASRLEQKLRSALGKLDSRSDILLKFYNDCSAKLAVMDRYTQDIEETRRLEELSGTADIAIAGAEDTLAAIGEGFVREAQAVGQALGGFARVQIKTLAGEAPLDDMEYLADRVIESADSERMEIEDLDRALNRTRG